MTIEYLNVPSAAETVTMTTIQLPLCAHADAVDVDMNDSGEYLPFVVIGNWVDKQPMRNHKFVDVPPNHAVNDIDLTSARYIGMYQSPATGPRHVFELAHEVTNEA